MNDIFCSIIYNYMQIMQNVKYFLTEFSRYFSPVFITFSHMAPKVIEHVYQWVYPEIPSCTPESAEAAYSAEAADFSSPEWRWCGRTRETTPDTALPPPTDAVLASLPTPIEADTIAFAPGEFQTDSVLHQTGQNFP